MQVKIKENTYNRDLQEIKGTWQEVDTTHLFLDQYNLKNYEYRILDKDVEAVKDDIRDGIIQCGYCGKTFLSFSEYEKHCDEEEKSSCVGCWWFRPTYEFIKEEEEETEENGEKILIVKTYHDYSPVCTFKKTETSYKCTHDGHRACAPTIFSKENCYFLKYPNGYDYYFENLSTEEKWRELGYIYKNKTAEKLSPILSYTIIFNKDGMTFKNQRSKIIIPSDFLLKKLNSRFMPYYEEREQYIKFPKSNIDAVAKFIDNIDKKVLQTFAETIYKD